MAEALVKRGNAAAQHFRRRPKGWPVSIHGGVAPLSKGNNASLRAAPCPEADRPTVSVNTNLQEYQYP
jgi:hypothetical protein